MCDCMMKRPLVSCSETTLAKTISLLGKTSRDRVNNFNFLTLFTSRAPVDDLVVNEVLYWNRELGTASLVITTHVVFLLVLECNQAVLGVTDKL